MIDEKSRRRPEFSKASVPIRLADGQEWYLPKPWTEIRPRMVAEKPIGLWATTTYGDELDLAVDAWRDAALTANNVGVILGTCTIGAFLLTRNYRLEDDELEGLLTFRFDTPEATEASMQMITEIADVAMGRAGPKAGSGGGC